ncbi:RNA polymerase sigma factor [uncultured Slackia sp.]|uniref:RNA polymerase sigma factor n=1 Tax=uncultured Slackia sp. TaxID=665903 RepID=UPI002675A28D|nr:RNA polymerase sigma factor [uncultured Slackia sp.]
MRVHGDAVYRLAFARCRNTADAEDIFQTTFLRFYASHIPFGNSEHEKAWLLRVCINACKDLQKSAWRTKVSAMPDEFDAPDTSARKETTPQEEALDEAMQGLSPEQRTVVHLHYFEGFSTGEIAQMLDMRSATVRSHLHRARIAMRNALEDAGFPQTNGRIGAPVEARGASTPGGEQSIKFSDSFHESALFNTDSLLEGGSNERR